MLKFEWTKKHTTILIYSCATLLLCALVVFAILFPNATAITLKRGFGMISPVFYGFAIAYLFDPVCGFFENKIFSGLAKKHSRAAHILSVVFTVLFAVLIITLFISILVPQVVSSYNTLESRFESYLKKARVFIREVTQYLRENDSFGIMPSFLGEGDVVTLITNYIGQMFGFVGNVADRIFEYSSKIISVTAKAVISVIFAVYFLLEKKKFVSWISKVFKAILSKGMFNSAKNWLEYTNKVFSSFITGKLINAMLITVVNFILFGICGIPYYPIIALITGVTDLIPYFGPFIGAVPCIFIILIDNPIKVIWFLVLVLVIQQIDANIIGPKILGEKVGADSLLIIVAITVGGSLFGIAGMFLSVPVFTVMAHMVNAFVNHRLHKKKLPTYSAAYKKDEGGV